MVLTLICVSLLWVPMRQGARRSRQQVSLKHTLQLFNDTQLFVDMDNLTDPLSLLDVAMSSVKNGWAADKACTTSESSCGFTTVVNSVFKEAVPGMISLIGIQFPVLSVLGGIMHGVVSQSGDPNSGLWAGKVINQMQLLLSASIWDLKRQAVKNMLWGWADRTQWLEYKSNLTGSIHDLLVDMNTDMSFVFGTCNQDSTSDPCQGWRTEAGAATLLYELIFTETFVALAAYGEKEAVAKKEKDFFEMLRTDWTGKMIALLMGHYEDLRQYRGNSSNLPYQVATSTKTDTGEWYQWSCEEYEYNFTVGRDNYLGRSVTGVDPCPRVRSFTETCCEWGLVGTKCASTRLKVNSAMRQWDECLSNYKSLVVTDLQNQFKERIENLKCC